MVHSHQGEGSVLTTTPLIRVFPKHFGMFHSHRHVTLLQYDLHLHFSNPQWQFFIELLAICWDFLLVFVHLLLSFLDVVRFLLLLSCYWVWWGLYIMCIRPLTDIVWTNISSHFVGCLFYYNLNFFFGVEALLTFVIVPFFCLFVFFLFASRVFSWKNAGDVKLKNSDSFLHCILWVLV